MSMKSKTERHMRLSLYMALLTLFTACGILGSDDDKEPLEPGPRNYEWAVDTLNSPPGGFIYDIWGSSPEDVWAVAGGGLNNLWHFNGKEWSVWDERVGSAFYSIHGFAQDDIWMGGNDGQLYHFDGQGWSQTYTFERTGLNNSRITDLQGTSTSNLYAIGTATPESGPFRVSFILHYNGRIWQELLTTDFGVQFQQLSTEELPTIRGEKYHQASSDTLLFYQYSNENLKEILSKTDNEVNSMSMNDIGNSLYYYIDNQILSFKNNDFQEILSFPNMELIIRLDGRHRKDLFLHTRDKIFHYNGENKILLLEDLPRNVFRSQLFSDEVFFVIRDYENGTNLVYHGTLTQEEE